MRRSIPEFQQIPEKVYFRIGEVSNLVGVDPHVLRYWETEFSVIRPFRGKSKQRLYRRQDVETLLFIKILLHDEGYTISGARKLLKGLHKHPHGQSYPPEAGQQEILQRSANDPEPIDSRLLKTIKTDLYTILEMLGTSRPAKEN